MGKPVLNTMAKDFDKNIGVKMALLAVKNGLLSFSLFASNFLHVV